MHVTAARSSADLSKPSQTLWGVCRVYNDSVKPDCDLPFNATPDCYTGFGEFMITSRECALSYSRHFNITDAKPLVAVAAAVNEIRSMCDAITTKVLPRSAVLHAPACIARQSLYSWDIFQIEQTCPFTCGKRMLKLGMPCSNRLLCFELPFAVISTATGPTGFL